MQSFISIQRTFCIVLLCVAANFLTTCNQEKEPYVDPEQLFTHPPDAAKPGVLWMWMGSNISKGGITADLEALQEEGFGKATMFTLPDITMPWSMPVRNAPTPQMVAWTTPWWSMVRHAAMEARRLGIDFGMFNCPGYETSGGPWITPNMSMQEICWSEYRLMGNNQRMVYQLPQPIVNPRSNMAYPVYNPATDSVENPVMEARKNYYRDIAVLALPATGAVKKSSIINLTDQLTAEGRIDWKAPAGDWIIYRLGHTSTGAIVQPAQWEASGLECDKMNPEAVSLHMDHIIGEIKKHLGDLVGRGFNHVHFDSYEAGTPNWTPRMKEEFSSRQGYDITPYLCSFAGRIIEDSATTQQFKNDFEATIQALYSDVYFSIVSQKLHRAHLDFTCEPYGGPWRQEDVLPKVKTVMTEFWTDSGRFTPYRLEPTVEALHKKGENIIEAEAFTGQPIDSRWTEYPAWLKPISDAAFCAGVNRLVLHRFVHQPWDSSYKPGNTMGQWGTHFDRTQTWWHPAKAMVQYWQRCQALLQWGHFVEKTADDFSSNTTDSIGINYVHRQLGTTQLYFIANTTHYGGQAICTFGTEGMQPELWDPVTGEIKDIAALSSTNSTTSIRIPFGDAQSYFVVFRKQANSVNINSNAAQQKEIIRITAPWQVRFDPNWGGPARPVYFDSLTDWTNRPEKGIRYYSGTAVYTGRFAVPMGSKSSVLYLDLGKVNHIAEVKLNGENLGVVWTAPWQIRIPANVIKDSNTLEIQVTNVWANRLIGDEQEPADMEWGPSQYFYNSGQYLKTFPDWFLKHKPRPSKSRYCFTTWNYFDKHSTLVPSGLLGPLRIMSQ